MIHSHRHCQKELPVEQRRLDNEIARTLEGYDFDKDALREKLFRRAALCYRQIGNEAGLAARAGDGKAADAGMRVQEGKKRGKRLRHDMSPEPSITFSAGQGKAALP